MATTLNPKPDKMLALLTFALVLFGVVMIYSASVIIAHQAPYFDDKHFAKRQLLFAVLGFVGTAFMANLDYHIWKKWAGWMLGITFTLLISVFFFSVGEVNGAHRWINLAGQTFQPSELAKLTFIIYVSAWLVGRKEQIDNIVTTFLPFLGILFLVSVLMLKEPDFGTLSVIAVSVIAIYYVAGMTLKQALLGLCVLVLAISIILGSPYRRARLLTFLNPNQDTSGSSYHIKNISIAIGSGGAWGLGFGESRQKRLFLPEPHTDSIFAITVEELGSIRALLVIIAFCFLLQRGFMVAYRSPDLFGRLLAVGITTWFGFQAFINLGSMLHLVPLVGVPLPFISSGGTNLVISLLAVGVLLNISSQASKAEPAGSGRKNRRKSV